MKSFNDITRRDFLKNVGLAAAAATFGCATTETPKQDVPSTLAATKLEPVIYPRLAGNKIQPPENGCLIGMRQMYADYNKNGFNEFMKILQGATDFADYEKKLEPNKWKDLFKLEDAVKHYSDYYKKALGENPKILVVYETPKLFRNFPTTEASIISRKGIIPYIYIEPCHLFKRSIGFSLDEIVNDPAASCGALKTKT